MNGLGRALADLDLTALRLFWGRYSPGSPQIASDDEALMTAHLARTASVTMQFRARAYSHAWLLERGLPSKLPDNLRPRAQRIYPVVHEGVGILASARSRLGRAILPEVRAATSAAVEDCYANGDTDPALVRRRIHEAKDAVVQRLLGARG